MRIDKRAATGPSGGQLIGRTIALLVGAAGLTAGLGGGMGGCVSGPRVGMSDPVVFTKADLEVANEQFGRAVAELTGDTRSQLSPFPHLIRAFQSPEKEYEEGKLRMDALLEGNQRLQSIARVVAQAVAVRAGFGKGVDAPADGDAGVGPDAVKIDAADLKALQAVLSGGAIDSPFDELERRRTFYQTFVITLLRYMRTDGRLRSPDSEIAVALIRAAGPSTETAIVTARVQIDRLDRMNAAIAEGKALQAPDLVKDKPADDVNIAVERYNAALQRSKQEQDKFEEAKKELDARRTSQNDKRTALGFNKAEVDKQLRAAALADTPSLRERYESQISAARVLADVSESELNEATDRVTEQEGHLAERTQAALAAKSKLNRAVHDVRGLVEAEVTRLSLAALKELPPPSKGSVETSRLIMLVLQPHIEPGNRPDVVVDIELELVDSGEKPIQTLFLHPTRSYDLADRRTLDAQTDALSLALAAKFPNAPAAIGLDADRRDRAEERAQYLSRIEKTTSFATRDENGIMKFGWVFYPSNLGANWKDDTVGFIEGGGRDCAAYLLVPGNATSLTLRMRAYERSLYRSVPWLPTPWRREISSGLYTVEIPPRSRFEGHESVKPDSSPNVMFTGGAAPTR
jgi:hypothetical protein